MDRIPFGCFGVLPGEGSGDESCSLVGDEVVLPCPNEQLLDVLSSSDVMSAREFGKANSSNGPTGATQASSRLVFRIASCSFLARSHFISFRSSRLLFVNSSATWSPCLPFRACSRLSQFGSLRLKLPLPKKPCSHRARIDLTSVTWTDLVSRDHTPGKTIEGSATGGKMTWLSHVYRTWKSERGLFG